MNLNGWEKGSPRIRRWQLGVVVDGTLGFSCGKPVFLLVWGEYMYLLMWKILVVVYITVYNKPGWPGKGKNSWPNVWVSLIILDCRLLFWGWWNRSCFFCLPAQIHRKSIQNGRGPLAVQLTLRFGRISSITLTCLGTCNTSVPTWNDSSFFFLARCQTYPSWWFQPIWNILVKLDHFPK